MIRVIITGLLQLSDPPQQLTGTWGTGSMSGWHGEVPHGEDEPEVPGVPGVPGSPGGPVCPFSPGVPGVPGSPSLHEQVPGSPSVPSRPGVPSFPGGPKHAQE